MRRNSFLLSFLFFIAQLSVAQTLSVPQYAVITPPPTTQASDLTLSEIADTQLTLTWTRGNGVEVIVVGRTSTSFEEFPRDAVTYTGNTAFGSGTQIATGNYVLYRGAGTTITVTALTGATSYYFTVYECNKVSDGKEVFNSTTSAENKQSGTTQATVNAPTEQATNLTYLGSERIEWTSASDATRYLLVVKQGSAVDATPSNTVTYTASTTFGQGSQLGTGNYVMAATTNLYAVNLKGFSPSTTYHFRVFAYNVAGTGPKYNTNTATGNPISKAMDAASTWVLHNESATQAANYDPAMKTLSQVVSKTPVIGFAETSTEYQIYCIADNNANSYPEPWHFDQTFLAIKSKSDGLPFKYGWNWYNDGSAPTSEPTPVFRFYDETVHASPAHTIQNHLCGPVVISDNSFIAAYVANESNIATRYSLGIARSTDGGRTWTRNASYVASENGNRSFYHPILVRDTDNSKYFIVVMNTVSAKYEVWESTDGLTGNTYSRKCTDLFQDVDIWSTIGAAAGWAAVSPMWKEGDGWHFYFVRNVIGNYHIDPETSTSKMIYNGSLYTTIGEAYIPTLNTATPKCIVKQEMYTVNKKVHVGLFPGSYKISHGGANHLLVAAYTFRQENITQTTADVKVLSDAAMTTNATQYGQDVYHNTVTKFFLPNDLTQNDTYQGSPVVPVEVLSGASGTVVNTPTVFCVNRIYCSNGYVTFPSWTHNTQYLGFKMVVPPGVAVLNNADRGLMEKAGTIKVFRWQGKNLEVWVYGDNGNIKKFRTVSNMQAYTAGKFGPKHSVIGVVCRFNGVDDIDVTINVDDYIDVPKTAIHVGDQKFTNIAQTSNVIKIGDVTGMSAEVDGLGQCVIFEGSLLTNTLWHNFNLL